MIADELTDITEIYGDPDNFHSATTKEEWITLVISIPFMFAMTWGGMDILYRLGIPDWIQHMSYIMGGGTP